MTEGFFYKYRSIFFIEVSDNASYQNRKTAASSIDLQPETLIRT